jgi:dephospho-CoA kinase
MALIYITGVSGCGKSTVQEALKRLGYTAYDVDDTALSGVFDNKTGERITMPPVNQRSPEWFATHSWLIIPEAIKRLKSESIHRLVFLCGAARNDKDFWQLFDTVIWLDVSESTLRQRITERKDNDYGKSESELESILKWHKKATASYKKLGAHIIDANKSLDTVVGQILNISDGL